MPRSSEEGKLEKDELNISKQPIERVFAEVLLLFIELKANEFGRFNCFMQT
jgi:hypothetical protein